MILKFFLLFTKILSLNTLKKKKPFEAKQSNKAGKILMFSESKKELKDKWREKAIKVKDSRNC